MMDYYSEFASLRVTVDIPPTKLLEQVQLVVNEYKPLVHEALVDARKEIFKDNKFKEQIRNKIKDTLKKRIEEIIERRISSAIYDIPRENTDVLEDIISKQFKKWAKNG